MKLKSSKIIFPVFVIILLSFLYVFHNSKEENNIIKVSKDRSADSWEEEERSVKDRNEYFFTMLRDPKTNRIPIDVVRNEMKFSESIKSRGLRKTTEDRIDWKEAGPKDVGGRTRALGVDIRDAKTVLAGGVSGGIWKTTDKGSTWEMKFTTSQVLSVSSLAQDIRAGHEDTWYAATGEISGNSASASGGPFRGAGIYKSADNGDTWSLLPRSDDITSWDNNLDYVSKIRVSPTTGSLFISSNSTTNAPFGGIYKSVDEGLTFERILATDSRYVEFDIASNGNIIATLSEDTNPFDNNIASASGLWFSQNDGLNWTNITPSNYPVGTEYGRAVAAIAPSNNDLCYILVDVDDANQDNRIYKLNLASNTSEDLSANLPDFTSANLPANKNNGIYSSQGGYDMFVAVKPDDENFVLIGGTNLYRSFDGFATPLRDYEIDWIGGYDHTGNFWDGTHPDFHAFAFEPGNPLRAWFGHDGGLSYAFKLTGKKGVDFSTAFAWDDKNNGYNVTQVYQVAIPHKAGDDRILIATQDNGTPFFKFDGATIFESDDVGSGDGAHSYFSDDYAYVSIYYGQILQVDYDNIGNVVNIYRGIPQGTHYARIQPASASGQLFINPFVIDPVGERIMYYPAGTSIWRNKNILNFNSGSGFPDGQDAGWVKLENSEAPDGYTYSAINVSNENNSHVLYFAAYKNDLAPKIYRLDNAGVSTDAAVDISVPDLPVGAFVNKIAVNPLNSNEIIVVATNYNIIGLYYSIDGGSTYTQIEGSLEGDDGKGPSIRSAAILPTASGTIYLVGTSVGLFSTVTFDGENTVWQQEGADIIGNVVVASIDARTEDGYVAVGTHGRGVFTGTAKEIVGVKQLEELPTTYSLSQNYPNPFNPTTKIRYSVPFASNVSLKIFNTNGEEVNEIVNQYQGAGTFEVDWNGTNRRGAKVASGAYIYTLRAGDFVQSKKMIMLK